MLSPTDPDASLMQHKRGATRLGYHAHYVVDGGKARVILNVLVTPARRIMENQPMLDLLFRTVFRWRARVRRVTGDAKYGTKEIVAAVEEADIRAYVSMSDSEKVSPYYATMRGSFTTPRGTSTGARRGTLAPVHPLLHRGARAGTGPIPRPATPAP